VPAHLPVDDARQLFNENTQRTWSGLLKVVEGHLNKADGIENEIVLMLIPVIKQLDKSGHYYPFDLDDFVRVINGAMAQQYAA
jgi:hypothetical protein